jgi:hypothetical protein
MISWSLSKLQLALGAVRSSQNPHWVDFQATPLDTCHRLLIYTATCANSRCKHPLFVGICRHVASNCGGKVGGSTGT